jgi:nicotinamide-nucleotide amidase
VSSTARAIHERLRGRGETVATAESLTAGLVAAALTEIAGSSSTFRGGVVVYATELKATLTGVPEQLLAERGPVDPAVAAAMAVGVRDRLDADWGVALTGVAGPDPQGDKPVGLVFVAVAGSPDHEVQVRELRLGGDRAAIRAAACEAALVQLLAVVTARR